jgi:nicotinate dehydrogenase subunit A
MSALPDHTSQIEVNGRSHAVSADPATPLLYVLRNHLGLHSPKFGCGLGKCGACTVLVDGEPVHACELPVGDLAGRAVTTLEGLGTTGALHPLQEAFLERNAAQCGYCIPGIVIRAAALLAANPDPTRDEIAAALAGNLCRCGSHVRILAAVARAAELARERERAPR